MQGLAMAGLPAAAGPAVDVATMAKVVMPGEATAGDGGGGECVKGWARR